LIRSRIADKSADVQRAIRVEQLEKVNAQLRTKRDATQLKITEVEHHELTLTSTYGDLKNGF
jgi:hypothetical protein